MATAAETAVFCKRAPAAEWRRRPGSMQPPIRELLPRAPSHGSTVVGGRVAAVQAPQEGTNLRLIAIVGLHC